MVAPIPQVRAVSAPKVKLLARAFAKEIEGVAPILRVQCLKFLVGRLRWVPVVVPGIHLPTHGRGVV